LMGEVSLEELSVAVFECGVEGSEKTHDG
jgi:hypothetical protein